MAMEASSGVDIKQHDAIFKKLNLIECSFSVAEPDKVLGWRTNEWAANQPGPGQTSALQIKTRSA